MKHMNGSYIPFMCSLCAACKRETKLATELVNIIDARDSVDTYTCTHTHTERSPVWQNCMPTSAAKRRHSTYCW